MINTSYSFDELRKNLDHLKRTQADNRGASTTLVKNNIASFMEAVDIMKGLLFDFEKGKNLINSNFRHSTFIS